ncbi:hypothetical protein C5E11_03480 [Clavibacter michiganensis]|nr:hypothetical protein C5E11_03480 [Clavibacter michiganensis]
MNEARYQLRQSPVTRRTKQRGSILADAARAAHIGRRNHVDTPGAYRRRQRSRSAPFRGSAGL